MDERMVTVLWAWAKGFGWMFGVIVAGVIAGRLSVRWWGVSVLGTTWLQYLGIALLLWATVGIAGWEVQSQGGVTPPEVLNRLIYRVLHLLGTFLLAWSVAWPTEAVLGAAQEGSAAFVVNERKQSASEQESG